MEFFKYKESIESEGTMEKFLVISGFSKKQGYIFKTNRLKENKGSSTIIKYVTEDLPKTRIETKC